MATSITSAYTSGQVNISGLGNGTDFNALIDGLVKAETVHITTLENWKQDWNDKVEQFQALNTKMLSLKTTLEGIDTMDSFVVKAVSTTDSTALTATADSTAQVSTHSVIVGQLAQNDILTTASGVSFLTTSVMTSNSNITFSYAGTSITLSNVSAGTTLTGLVNYINNNALCSGKIKATTIYDGSVYHLQIYGLGQGDANQVIISNTGGLVFQPAAFDNTQNAQSSHIKVDGYPVGAATWLSRDSNTVSDIVPGVTLNLKKADPTNVLQIDISTDKEAIKENIKTFVAQVNEVRTMIKEMTKVDTTNADSPKASLLTGNYAVQMISTQLKDVCADKALGFNYYSVSGGTITGDYFSSLSQLGISTDSDQGSITSGLLVLDEDVLNSALATDPDAVAKLFAADYLGESQSPDFTYLSHIGGTTKAGSYEVSITTDGTGITSATINGHAAGIDGWRITGAYGYDEAGLVIQLDNQVLNNTTTGTVNLKLGKAGEMISKLKEITSSTTGPLHILEENYGDITDSIDKKIDYETTRIAKLKASMQEKYARLDALLGKLAQQQTQLTSAITQLTS
ncbi:MAG: flagellar filament capping protein FliD [Proteobacteria bacterium]|nr:flagellar filament capping protein FliD [Pseudomonadota bacterium]